MARGRKAGSSAIVKEEKPKIFFSEDYMGKCDRLQITLYRKNNKKSLEEEIEEDDDDKEEGEVGWYRLGHYGWRNYSGIFDAIETDMLYLKVKKAKVIDNFEKFEKLYEKNHKEVMKLIKKYDESLKDNIPDDIKKKHLEIETKINKGKKNA